MKEGTKGWSESYEARKRGMRIRREGKENE